MFDWIKNALDHLRAKLRNTMKHLWWKVSYAFKAYDGADVAASSSFNEARFPQEESFGPQESELASPDPAPDFASAARENTDTARVGESGFLADVKRLNLPMLAAHAYRHWAKAAGVATLVVVSFIVPKVLAMVTRPDLAPPVTNNTTLYVPNATPYTPNLTPAEAINFLKDHTRKNAEGVPVGTDGRPLHIDNTNPILAQHGAALIEHMDEVQNGRFKGEFEVTDACRTVEEIVRLEKNKANSPYPVAPPGPHNTHQHCVSLDIPTKDVPATEAAVYYKELHDAAPNYGLKTLAPVDPIHVQFADVPVTFHDSYGWIRREFEGGYDGYRTNGGVNGKYHGLGKDSKSMTPKEVAALTPEQQEAIIKRDFWDKYKIESLPSEVRAVTLSVLMPHPASSPEILAAARTGDAVKVAEVGRTIFDGLLQDPKNKGNKTAWDRRDAGVHAMAEIAMATKNAAGAVAPVQEVHIPTWRERMANGIAEMFHRKPSKTSMVFRPSIYNLASASPEPAPLT